MNANRREWLSPALTRWAVCGMAVRDASRLLEGYAFQASFAGLHSASELAPWSPACPQAYGSDCVRESRYWVAVSSSSRGKVVPYAVQADRSRRSHEHVKTHDPAPAFASIRVHSRQKNKNASQARRLCDCPVSISVATVAGWDFSVPWAEPRVAVLWARAGDWAEIVRKEVS
jgi:hypothetical protein